MLSISSRAHERVPDGFIVPCLMSLLLPCIFGSLQGIIVKSFVCILAFFTDSLARFDGTCY